MLSGSSKNLSSLADRLLTSHLQGGRPQSTVLGNAADSLLGPALLVGHQGS